MKFFLNRNNCLSRNFIIHRNIPPKQQPLQGSICNIIFHKGWNESMKNISYFVKLIIILRNDRKSAPTHNQKKRERKIFSDYIRYSFQFDDTNVIELGHKKFYSWKGCLLCNKKTTEMYVDIALCMSMNNGFWIRRFLNTFSFKNCMKRKTASIHCRYMYQGIYKVWWTSFFFCNKPM